MSSRVPGRLIVLALATLRLLRRQPFDARRSYGRILVAHNLLLGDTLLLTPLLAKLHRRYPAAEIWMTAAPAFVPLYAGRPYGVRVLPYRPDEIQTLWPWLQMGGFDLAIVPGDNRYAWLARALGARCVVALAEDRHGWKDWQVDKNVSWPAAPTPLADIFASLVDGAAPPPYATDQWPIPPSATTRPTAPYCVFHVSARNPLRRWNATHWRSVADALRQSGLHIVWSAAPGEAELVEDVGPASDDSRMAGTLDLVGLRDLLSGAQLLITVETGIAHLCRLTGTPSVVIFGQGNPAIHGSERFWHDASPMHAVFDESIVCRNQTHLFGRRLPWVRRCDRGPQSCAQPLCIEGIFPEHVVRAATSFIRQSEIGKNL